MKSERNQKSRERKSEIRRTGNQIKLCCRELCPLFFEVFCTLTMSYLNQRSKGQKESFSRSFRGSFCPVLRPVCVQAEVLAVSSAGSSLHSALFNDFIIILYHQAEGKNLDSS